MTMQPAIHQYDLALPIVWGQSGYLRDYGRYLHDVYVCACRRLCPLVGIEDLGYQFLRTLADACTAVWMRPRAASINRGDGGCVGGRGQGGQGGAATTTGAVTERSQNLCCHGQTLLMIAIDYVEGMACRTAIGSERSTAIGVALTCVVPDCIATLAGHRGPSGEASDERRT